jgi:hypothetical protein
MSFEPTSLQKEIQELYLHNKRITREDLNIEAFITNGSIDIDDINDFRAYISQAKDNNYNLDSTLNNADKFVAYQNILRAVDLYIADNDIISINYNLSNYYAFSSDLDAMTAGAEETTLSSYALVSSLTELEENLSNKYALVSTLDAMTAGAEESTLSSYALASNVSGAAFTLATKSVGYCNSGSFGSYIVETAPTNFDELAHAHKECEEWAFNMFWQELNVFELYSDNICYSNSEHHYNVGAINDLATAIHLCIGIVDGAITFENSTH